MNLSKSRGTKISYKNIRKQAWDLQSKRIRMEGPVCVTCGARPEWKELQAGHFIHGNSMDFVEHNIHSQCVRCNKYLHGNLMSYTLFIQKKYGMAEVERLQALKSFRQKGHKISEMELIFIIKKEKAKIKELEGL